MRELITKAAYEQEKEIAISRKTFLLEGEEAFALLSDPTFQSGWDALYTSCPWGTVFQSRAFVSTWYQIYRKAYQPILVMSEQEGQLTGLLTMALPQADIRRKSKKCIVGAGASQAEYQVWLTSASDGWAFINNALLAILDRFRGSTIQLKYIPGKAPVEWALSDKVWRKQCVVRRVKQPLIVLDEARLNNELRKKNRREKVNRLKRMGNLTFERIKDIEVFSSIFDDLALQYDFRKEAMFNVSFFRADPLRKKFLLALFEQDLLHATILKLDEKIIASNVGATGRKWVHLQGINTHAPSYAKYSPGILHFLMSGKLMSAEGIEVFDLTPGADTYKGGLATDCIWVHQLDIVGAAEKQTREILAQLVAYFKKGATLVGLKAGDLKRLKREVFFLREKVRFMKYQNMTSLAKSLISQSFGGNRSKTFCLVKDTSRFSTSLELVNIKCCDLEDLLSYDERGAQQTRWEFLKEAMRRFEAGDRSYTWSEGGQLLACAWLSCPKPAVAGEGATTTGGRAELQGLYCHPAGLKQFEAFVESVTGLVVQETGLDCIYAVANVQDTALCEALKNMSSR